MPDWFYRTVSQPILFRFSAPRARDFALGFMGGLSRLPFGPYLIDFLGHMRANSALAEKIGDVELPTIVGIGPWLDTNAVAVRALARFGVGFIEVGPVALDRHVAARPIKRLDDREALWIDDETDTMSIVEGNRRLRGVSDLVVPVIVRLACPRGKSATQIEQETRHLMRELAPGVRLVSLDVLESATAWSADEWSSYLRAVLAEANDTKRTVLLTIAADQDLEQAQALIDDAVREGVAGVIVDGTMRAQPDGRLVGLPVRESALQQVAKLRERSELVIIASGGVHEPEHALELRAAGADFVQVDTGLVFTGPGLPKRINECLLYQAMKDVPAPREERVANLTWFWTTAMGLGMMVGGVMALIIAATKVVLPYDESFLGMSREALPGINPQLLDFMAHDRISLAGVMVAIGLLYIGLSTYGIRQGMHWARQSVLISAFTGFASFFLFLGFGYLDPFHAFVTVALLQLMLLGLHSKLGPYLPRVRPDARTNRAWRVGLWGQLLLVIHGFALLGAGLTISAIGVSEVFVHEDLEFMRTTADALATANPRLVPLVAHDRATLGGMLLAGGWVFLLPALWGFRRGSSWLWWTSLMAGVIAYAAAIGVHYAVGYLSVKHLLPAFGGFALLMIGLLLSYSFLCKKE